MHTGYGTLDVIKEKVGREKTRKGRIE